MWGSQWCCASCPGFQSWEPLLGRGEKENTTEMINEYKKIFKISIVRTFNSVIANIVAMFKHSSSLGQQKMKVASLIGTFHCTGKIFAAQLDSVNNLNAYNRRQDYALRSCEHVHSAAQSTLTTVHGGFPRRHPPITSQMMPLSLLWWPVEYNLLFWGYWLARIIAAPICLWVYRSRLSSFDSNGADGRADFASPQWDAGFNDFATHFRPLMILSASL